MRIPIAKEGYIFILPLAVLTGIFWTLSWLWAVGLFGGLFLFVTWFFRDPERNIPEDPNAIVSPGDGKVVEIIQEKDPLLD
ncbi:MAG: phosphatidylserine decarboxylase family protein, partial [Nitrospina sp.]|nr:phosphatidylserine decarboxylase family protein [Nitrospina sp.]